MKMKTSQPGHWYECKNAICRLKLPLPDKIFIENNHTKTFIVDCKCGYMNLFKYSDAQGETKKLEVDKYFGINDPKAEVGIHWEE